jgi:gliding motility-associated-like protein
MKKLLLLLLCALSFQNLSAQNNLKFIDLGPDTSLCNGGSITLNAQVNLPPGITSSGLTVDDYYSSLINLGFTFNFYGVNYTSCVISGNGYLSFNAAYADDPSPWQINNPLPSPNNPLNSIMAPWQDLDPGVSGSVNYVTMGTAPNRKFVVTWDVPMYSCNSSCFGNQVVIYEGSNIIETFLGDKQLCPTWNGGQAIHGLQNANGTLACVVPGRNSNSQWTALMEGMRFTPSGNNYTISNIAFVPVYMNTSSLNDINWYILGSNASIGTNPSLTINPSQNITYVASLTSVTCGGTAQATSYIYYDTINVAISNPVVSITTQNADCFTGVGGVMSATVTGAALPYNFSWNTTPVNNNATVTGVFPGNYVVTLTDANGCISQENVTITQQGALTTNIVSTTDLLCNGIPTGNLEVNATGTSAPYVYILGNDTSYIGVFSNLTAGLHNVKILDAIGCVAIQPVTLNEPPLPLSLVQNTKNDVSCFGKSDGIATFTAQGGTPPYNYSNGSSISTSGFFSNLPPSPYLFAVSDANGCYTIFKDTIKQPEPLVASIINFTNVVCKGQDNGTATVLASGGTVPYFYNWNAVPAQNNAMATSLSPGQYSVTVSDNNGCLASNNVLISEPEQLQVIANDDLSVCQNIDTLLVAFASGGNGKYQYNWLPDNLTNDSIVIAPMSSTIYTITITDSLGCTVSEPVDVTVFNTPEPIITKNASSGCETFCPTFTDLTPFPLGSINTIREWNFGDGQTAQNDSIVDHCYKNAGAYTVTLTVVTDKGCRKIAAWEEYINVYPNPVANIEADPTQTDIMNPTITFENLSVGGDQYYWNFGDNDSIFNVNNPHHTYADTGIYTVRMIAVTDNNCYDSTKTNVIITPFYTFFIPKSFTPNGDGLNDLFEIKGSYIQACSIEIYDRWGKPFYSRSGTYGVSWDGANAPQGSYVYKIIMKDTQNKDYEYVGELTVLR